MADQTEETLTQTAQPVALTDDAQIHAERLMAEHSEYQGKSLRIYLSGKGCSGFEYGVAFDEREKQDVCFSIGRLSLVIDPDTIKYVKGSVLSWVDDERGQGFLVENPNHKKFRGKFFRRDDWQSKLLGGNEPPEISTVTT